MDLRARSGRALSVVPTSLPMLGGCCCNPRSRVGGLCLGLLIMTLTAGFCDRVATVLPIWRTMARHALVTLLWLPIGSVLRVTNAAVSFDRFRCLPLVL